MAMDPNAWWNPWPEHYWSGGGPIWTDRWTPGTQLPYGEWRPPWYDESQPDYQEAVRRFRQDLGANDALAWQEYLAYLTNEMLRYMNPEAAQSFIDALQITGGEGFANLYQDYTPELGTDQFTLTPGLAADRYFQQASRWDAILEGFSKANAELIGDNLKDKTEFSEDTVLDPFESMTNWFYSLGELGKKYGLSETRKRLNRWQQQDYYNELQNLMALAPNEQIAQLGYALIEQPKYTVPETPVQLTFGNFANVGAQQPFSPAFGYRNNLFA